ncbi:MAG TPA: ABC transporter permease subunit [Phycisphaerae bacterium]|nr:ABC transporter permease subunit [Phycisphaerae bacterium]HNU45811.1 ABC transporter permease subunit [Phycisphaerae bacterium]
MLTTVLGRLWLWFWHLIPANPILVRVVFGGSRRIRHLWLRVGYLVLLLLVVLVSLFNSMSGSGASLAEFAKAASQTFAWASRTQLLLICFLAPVFTAAAITQERDAQTFNILISTPLTNAQIVFGSLLSRLFFVVILLVAGLPIFLLTMVYGGVTTGQIMESFALAGATGILTGVLAITVAMIRVGTRRTIFSFFLVIALYLLTIYILGRWQQTWVPEAPENVDGMRMSWLTPLHPFLALEVALNQVQAPAVEQLGGYWGPVRYALAYPSATYVLWTLTLALLLTTLAMLFVRRGIKTGEPTPLTLLTQRLGFGRRGQRTRPPRTVWSNPVAWREACTRASAGGAVRWVVAGAGLVVAGAILIYHLGGGLTASEVRKGLALLISVQFAITLLIAVNAAATTMTREKDSKTMDLLLTTLLTSRYILWGKLRGLVSFCLPLVGGPVLALLVFGLLGLFTTDPHRPVWIETALQQGVLMVVYAAFACVLGLQISLTARKSTTAVMYAVGTLILLCAVASAIGTALVEAADGAVGCLLAPFTPFTAIFYGVDPTTLFQPVANFAGWAPTVRVCALVGTAMAAALYVGVIFSLYRPLVRNFDMIMRRQSGT